MNEIQAHLCQASILQFSAILQESLCLHMKVLFQPNIERKLCFLMNLIFFFKMQHLQGSSAKKNEKYDYSSVESSHLHIFHHILRLCFIDQVQFIYLFQFSNLILFILMLSNISINDLRYDRPKSSKNFHTSQRLSLQQQKQNQYNQSIFLNPEKIILPVKEYSNKFLRQNKTRDKSIYRNCKKRSMIYVKKQIRQKKVFKSKENKLKTQTTFEYFHSKEKSSEAMKTPLSQEKSRVSNDKISTSRALQMFSKVYKKEGIERMKVRKEIINKTSDVEIKQVNLFEKQEKQKKKLVYPLKGRNLIAKSLSKQQQEKNLFEDDNFQLVGW